MRKLTMKSGAASQRRKPRPTGRLECFCKEVPGLGRMIETADAELDLADARVYLKWLKLAVAWLADE